MTRAWFWPSVVTGALGLWHIGQPELWRDELRSWSAASRSLGDLFHLLGNTDAAVALYYLVLHFWMQVFGDSAVAMRIPSLLAMSGAAACVTLVGQRLYDRRAGIVGGLIFAVIPAVARFSQEVRPYAITMLLVGVSALLYLRALETPTRRRWLGYAISVAGIALTQVVALAVLAAYAVGLLIWKRRERRTWVAWAVWTAVGLAAAAPVIALSMGQYDHQVGSLPPATLGELTLLPPRLFSSTATMGAVVALGVLAFARKVAPASFLAAWAVLPIGIVWLASNLGQSYWMTRYMLPTLPAFALLAGAAVAMVANMRVVVILLAAIMAVSIQDHRAIRSVGAHDNWNYPESYHDSLLYSQAAALIAERLRPGDGVMYTARQDYWLLDIGLAYHLRGQSQPADVMVEQSALQVGDFWPVECDEPATCIGDTPRIWLVSTSVLYGPDGIDALEPEKKAVLEQDYRVVDTFNVSGIAVVLWERDA